MATKTTKAPAKKVVAKKATVRKAPTQKNTSHADGLHYDKEALIAEYKGTFPIAMKFLIFVVGAGLVYFFLMLTYLGSHGQNKHEPYAKQFGGENGRIETDYSGLKLPIDGGKSKEEFAAEKMAEHHAHTEEEALTVHEGH